MTYMGSSIIFRDLWYTAPEHSTLGPVALHLGPWLVLYSLIVGDFDEGIAELQRGGKPMTVQDIAKETRFRPAEIESALGELVLCGTMKRMPSGAWALADIHRWSDLYSG